MNDQSVQIEAFRMEASLLREKLAEANAKLEGMDGCMVDSQRVFRLEGKVKDLEAKLDLEQTTKKRQEVNRFFS